MFLFLNRLCFANVLINVYYIIINVYYVKGHAVITILPPIPTEGMTKEDLTSLIEKSRSAMQETYTKSSAEMKTKYYNVS